MSEQPTDPLENEVQLPANETPPQPLRRSPPGLVWPLILTFAGVVLLLNTTGVLPWWIWERLCLFWPVVLILWGIDLVFRRQSHVVRMVLALAVVALLTVATIYLVAFTDPGDRFQTLRVECPLDGSESGEVNLRLMVGHLEVGELADSNAFARAQVEVEDNGDLEQYCRAQRSVARLDLSDTGWRFQHLFTLFRRARWQVDLSPRLSLELDIEMDVGDSHLDLQDLRAEAVEIETHVGEVQVTLPAQVQRGHVRIRCDVGNVVVTVPEGVAVRIDAETDVGETTVDGDRFPWQSEGIYQSPDYSTAPYRLDVEIEVAAGAITVR